MIGAGEIKLTIGLFLVVGLGISMVFTFIVYWVSVIFNALTGGFFQSFIEKIRDKVANNVGQSIVVGFGGLGLIIAIIVIFFVDPYIYTLGIFSLFG